MKRKGGAGMPEDKRTSSARYDGEPVTGGDFTDEFAAIVYEDIMHRIEGKLKARMYDDGIIFDDYQLTLSCTIQRIGDFQDHFAAEMLYIMTHRLFDEPLCEYCSGIGGTAEEAIINGAEQFTQAVLSSVISTLDRNNEASIVSDLAGMTRTFIYTDDAYIYAVGECDESGSDLFSHIVELIPGYLGTKKAYWIKLFVAWYDDRINAEVRINGAVMSGLSEALRIYASERKIDLSYHSEKQFVLLIDPETQDDEPYAPPELVIDITKSSIEALSEVIDEETETNAFFRIRRLCGKWERLYVDLLAFLPDLFTCYMLHINQGDDLRLRTGDAVILLKRSQLRYFGYIEQGIIQYLNEVQISDESAYNVMSLGKIIDAVSEIVENGTSIENIGISELSADLPEDYELY